METELDRLRRELEAAERMSLRYDLEVKECRDALAAEEARIAAKSKYPARGTPGWVVDVCGHPFHAVWDGGEDDRAMFDSGNWHATEAEAIAARDAWLAFNKLRKAGLRIVKGVCVQDVFPVSVSKANGVANAYDALPPEQRAALAGTT